MREFVHAFCDLLNRHGIKTRLVRPQDRMHTLLEAQTESGWLAIDPKLELVFLTPIEQKPLSIAEVRADIERVVQILHPTPAVEKLLRDYYRAEITNTEDYQPVPAAQDYTFRLKAGDRVEYDFNSTYPWLTARDVTTPPAGVLGAFKQSFQLSNESRQLHLPFPIVDVEAQFKTGAASLFINDQAAKFNRDWDFVRLRRYLKNGQRDLKLAVENNEEVNLTVVSQFSSLPFNTQAGAFLLVKANRDARIEVEVEFY